MAVSTVAFYRQTFDKPNCLLDPLLNDQHMHGCTEILTAALHVGFDPKTKQPYLHLNNIDANDESYNQMYEKLEKLSAKGCAQHIMFGGAAGGDFTNLFNHFNTFYPMIKSFLLKHPFFTGINLDVEETNIATGNVIALIKTLRDDFKKRKSPLIISMAPVQEALESGGQDPYGLEYEKLKPFVDQWYVQCYGEELVTTTFMHEGASACSLIPVPRCINQDSVQSIINNGYEPNKLVFGIMGQNGPEPDFKSTTLEIMTDIMAKFPKVSGFFVWEYCLAPPNPQRPYEFSDLVSAIKIDQEDKKLIKSKLLNRTRFWRL